MKLKYYPNVLVISHNVFSSTSNMGKTMASFFRDWNKENIAQLFLHSEIPNTDICTNYYRITDFDIVKSIIKFQEPVGIILSESDVKINAASNRIDTGIKSDIYQIGRKRRPWMYLIRDFMWSIKKWNTDQLMEWINDFNPEVVFFAAGDYSFSIKIAQKICRLKNLPMIVFFGDDYFFLENQSFSVFKIIHKNIYRNNFKIMFNYLSVFIAANDKMKIKYQNEFNNVGYTIMTSAEISDSTLVLSNEGKIRISYIGNLGLNRWKPLIEIGKCLRQIGYVLDIYSGETRESTLSHLNIGNGIRFHGCIPANEVNNIIYSSTIIIHVEAFDKINRQKTKYSMSTKIAESLASGVCLFAYGPDDVSSMEYLVENEAACVVTKKEDLKNKLNEIIKNDDLRKKYIYNALKLAKMRHNYEANLNQFYQIIIDVCESWENGFNHENTSS